MKRYFIILLIEFGVLFLLGACRSGMDHKLTKVIIEPVMWNNEVMYIKAIPFNKEDKIYIDSVTVKDARNKITFIIPDTQERIYEISVRGRKLHTMFINDSPLLYVKVNYFSNKDTVMNSMATASLRKLAKIQLYFDKQLYSLANSGNTYNELSKRKQYADIIKNRTSTITHFADTVSSPALVTLSYNSLEFGKDFNALKSFMQKAVQRFPSYKPILELKKATDSYIDIYTKELQVGDKMPFIQLPDDLNHQYTTKDLKGKYYFLDFWASWCGPCMPYSQPKRVAYKTYSGKNFAMVSVFLDDHKEAWKNISTQEHFVWKQLIDEQQWNGIAAKTIKFDSIPFNYLISPEGKILAKAIKPDSLLQTLAKIIK